MPPRQHTVVVADDEPALTLLFERLLVKRGFLVLTAQDGAEALALVKQAEPDLVLADVRMPRMDGFALCEAIKADPATRLIPVVLMTGAAAREDRMRAIALGADDLLSKPVDDQELTVRVGSLIRLKSYTDDLMSAEGVIEGLALTIEARDPYTDGHCQRLSAYGVALGRRLGLEEQALNALRWGGVVHDIGKIAIPDAILLKPAALTADEFKQMQSHTIVGDRLCGRFRALDGVRPIVRSHHERLDGTGYPDGLKGDAVPLLAQIISIADVFDAVTSERPYKPALSTEEAYEALRGEVRRGWKQKELVDAFIAAGLAGELDREITARAGTAR